VTSAPFGIVVIILVVMGLTLGPGGCDLP